MYAVLTVGGQPGLRLSQSAAFPKLNAGSNVSYAVTLPNNGPSNAASASLSDTLPAGTTFVSLSTTCSWACSTPAVGATRTGDVPESELRRDGRFLHLDRKGERRHQPRDGHHQQRHADLGEQ